MSERRRDHLDAIVAEIDEAGTRASYDNRLLADELDTLRAQLAAQSLLLSDKEGEIAELKLALLVGTNHLEGIDFSGPGRKRMQSARSWYVTVREKFALAAKESV